MSWLFNSVYLVLILLASPSLLYARFRHGKYRDGWAAKFLGRVDVSASNEPVIWCHAVSVGEVNALATILEPLRRSFSDCQFFITTTTSTGYELASKKFAGDTVSYAPLDFSWAVRRALELVQPSMIVLIELELWPNLLLEAEHRKVPVAVVNGRLSESSFLGYRRLRSMLRPAFASLGLVAAQNEEYATRFRDLGIESDRVIVTGSVKFDGAQSDRSNPLTKRLKSAACVSDADCIFLAGSTQRGEEAIAIDAFHSVLSEKPRLRMLIVPRHPERFDEVATLLEKSGIPWLRRSLLDTATSEELGDWRILLVDTVGELGGWWGLADLAFVGGSLGSRGGQNMIEPAAYGAAVTFGPNTRNFRDVTELLLDHQAAEVVHGQLDLESFLRRGMDASDGLAEMGLRAKRLVADQRGATDRTVDLLRMLAGDAANADRIRRLDGEHASAVPVRKAGALTQPANRAKSR